MPDRKDKGLEAPASPPLELPMACQRAGALIEKLLAGVVEPDERTELETHLAACAQCRQYHADARALANLFHGIRLHYSELPAGKRRWRLWWALPLAAAMILVLAAGIFYRLTSAPKPEPPMSETALEPDPISELLGIVIGVRNRDVEPLASGPEGLVGGRVDGAYPAGLLIVEVLAGSWAERTGLERRDRILEAAGVALQGEAGRWALGYLLRNLKPGAGIALLIYREGRVFEAKYRHGER